MNEEERKKGMSEKSIGVIGIAGIALMLSSIGDFFSVLVMKQILIVKILAIIGSAAELFAGLAMVYSVIYYLEKE